MEDVYTPCKDNQEFKLPTGFRFHPTDEELIKCYLRKKAVDNCFCAVAIAEVDLNKCEPWNLPALAKMGETEWYFFGVRDRKYPTGLRTNRATDAGYWKATGKDREIIAENAIIGMKKSLVFYKGRAPRGEKTDWVMHEYRLEGRHNQDQSAQSDWVVCRVFVKGRCGKQSQVPNSERFNSSGNESSSPSAVLPPLMDSPPPPKSETRTTAAELSQVTSSEPNQTVEQNTHGGIVHSLEPPVLDFSSSASPFDVYPFGKASLSAINQAPQIAHQIGDSQYPDYSYMPQEQSMRMQMEKHEASAEEIEKAELSEGRDFEVDISSLLCNSSDMIQRMFGNEEHSSTSAGHVDTDCMWNY